MFTQKELADVVASRTRDRRADFQTWFDSPIGVMLRDVLARDTFANTRAVLEAVYNAGFDDGGAQMLMHVLTVVVNQREPVQLPRVKAVG